MLKVGITGGIGSGKTTVCKIFEALGIPVYYADDRAKSLMQTVPELITAIKNLFGSEAYDPDGSLNRQYIASIAFNDPDKLQKLNRLVHPVVLKDGLSWHFSQSNVPYTIKEAALLIESGSYRQLDKLIVVTAPVEIRIRRVMVRDKVSENAVLERIHHQMPEEEKTKLADFVIVNDGTRSIVRQVWQIHRKLSLYST